MTAVAPATKSFSHRRSATGCLKAIGIEPKDYDLFIKEVEGKFVVNLDSATDLAFAQLRDTTGEQKEATEVKAAIVEAVEEKPTRKQRKAAKPAKTDAKTGKAKAAPKKVAELKKAAPTRKDGKLPVSQRCLELFKAGKSNGEVWAVVAEEYGLGEDKAHYPAWYRSHFRRRGELPKGEARTKKVA